MRHQCSIWVARLVELRRTDEISCPKIQAWLRDSIYQQGKILHLIKSHITIQGRVGRRVIEVEGYSSCTLPERRFAECFYSIQL